jgi:hypothetical protein
VTTVIVPLAGPDLFSNKFGIRPLMLVKDEFLIDAVIKKRFWYKNFNSNTDKLVFILRNIEIGLDNLKNHLTNNYPNCKIIVLSHLTKGAAFSVIPGLAYAEAFEHVIVDLADIITINEFNYKEKFQENTLLKLKLFLIPSNLLEQLNKLLEQNSLVLMILKKIENINLIWIMAQFIILQKMMKRTKIQAKLENQLNMLKNNYSTDFLSMQKKRESTIKLWQMDSSAREKQTLKKVTMRKLDQKWIEKRKRNFKERKKRSLKKRERKLSKSYKKNSIDKQPKKLKLKSKQLSLPKRRQILKKDSSIFNLKHLKKSNKNLMIKITELICF